MTTRSSYCSDCKYFYYDKAPYSETYVGCDRNHWSTPSYETDFRYAMRKASSCPDFSHVTLKELEPGLLSSDVGKPKISSASPIDRQMAEAFKVNLELKKKFKQRRAKKA